MPPRHITLYRRSLAVVIGIDTYEHLPDLKAAESDATELARRLRNRGFEVRTLLGKAATRARIASVLGDELYALAQPDDRVLVYFAGHGISEGQGDARVGYLLPAAADPKQPAADAIAMTELVRWFGRYKARHVMLLADACYSGLALSTRAAGLRPAMERYLQAITQRRARFALVGGGAGEQVNEWVDDAGRRGLFTHFLLQAIDGAADANRDCIITSDEIAAYVKPEVARQAQLLWGAEQHPQSGRSGEGEFIFLTAPGGSKGCHTPIVEAEAAEQEVAAAAARPGVAAAGAAATAPAPIASPAGPPAALVPGPPDIRVTRRAAYPHVDLTVERRVAQAIALQADTSAPERQKAAAWCDLAALNEAEFYRPLASEACRSWRGWIADGGGVGSLRDEHARLLGYLQLSHVGRAERVAALQRFVAMFPQERASEPVQAAVVALEQLQSGLAPAAAPAPAGWLRIEPGTFTMGTPLAERPRDSDEAPVEVQIERPFLLQRGELTQARWQQLMGDNPSTFKGCGGECPVEEVSFWDALALANAASDADGLPRCYTLTGCTEPLAGGGRRCVKATFKGIACTGYRLPTEAEWEYAARAGTTTATYAGPLRIRARRHAPGLDAIAWHGGHNGVSYAGAGDCSHWEGRAHKIVGCGTHPTGRLQPNAWGAHDMIGNVWEWVWSASDPRQGAYGRASSTTGDRQASRGGGWYNDVRDCRAANRFVLHADTHYFNVGLRLARTL